MKRTKLYKTYNILIRSVIIIASLFFLYYQFFVKQQFSMMLNDLNNVINSRISIVLLIFSFALMPLNWFIESAKWRYLLLKHEKISYLKAIKAVLSGASISLITPNRTGDYFGRVFILKKTKFWNGVFITVIGSYAQTITTLIIGSISFFLVFASALIENDIISSTLVMYLRVISFVAVLIITTLYFKISLLSTLLPAKWEKIHNYVDVFKEYSVLQLVNTLMFSMLRYVVFTLQFYLILIAVGFTDLSFVHGFALISTIFFINSIKPTIALFEVFIRGSVAVFVFSNFCVSDYNTENMAFIASSLIWFINIVLPAVLGLFFVVKLKFLKSNK